MSHCVRRVAAKFSILVTVIAIALQLHCALNTFAAAPAKHIVGYVTYTARIVPLWLAQEQGFFTKYGIETSTRCSFEER